MNSRFWRERKSKPRCKHYEERFCEPPRTPKSPGRKKGGWCGLDVSLRKPARGERPVVQGSSEPASYHGHLDRALTRRILEIRAARLLVPLVLLVVRISSSCPSCSSLRRRSEKQLAHFPADVGTSHEAFTDEDATDAGFGKFFDVLTGVDAALAHQDAWVFDELEHPERVTKIGLERPQVAVVDAEQAVAAVRETDHAVAHADQ